MSGDDALLRDLSSAVLELAQRVHELNPGIYFETDLSLLILAASEDTWRLPRRKEGMMTNEEIARVCHEVNRAYCESLGDTSQPAWEDAPEWQRKSVVVGVELHREGDHSPAASHESWMDQKRADGWQFGDVKDSKAKTHPCYRPFDELPLEQQAKDFIFRAVVHALR